VATAEFLLEIPLSDIHAIYLGYTGALEAKGREKRGFDTHLLQETTQPPHPDKVTSGQKPVLKICRFVLHDRFSSHTPARCVLRGELSLAG